MIVWSSGSDGQHSHAARVRERGWDWVEASLPSLAARPLAQARLLRCSDELSASMATRGQGVHSALTRLRSMRTSEAAEWPTSAGHLPNLRSRTNDRDGRPCRTEVHLCRGGAHVGAGETRQARPIHRHHPDPVVPVKRDLGRVRRPGRVRQWTRRPEPRWTGASSGARLSRVARRSARVRRFRPVRGGRRPRRT